MLLLQLRWWRQWCRVVVVAVALQGGHGGAVGRGVAVATGKRRWNGVLENIFHAHKGHLRNVKNTRTCGGEYLLPPGPRAAMGLGYCCCCCGEILWWPPLPPLPELSTDAE